MDYSLALALVSLGFNLLLALLLRFHIGQQARDNRFYDHLISGLATRICALESASATQLKYKP